METRQQRKESSGTTSLTDRDISELADFFDLLAQYDYEDARKEGRPELTPKRPSFDSAPDASGESV